MTVIAWDGNTLAADKRTSMGGLHCTTTKVHRVGETLVAGCGNAALMREMLVWLQEGADPAKLPSAQRDPKECVSILVITLGGRVLQYESGPHPLVVENQQWAIGSGRDFAVMAMRLGKSAVEAVELTAEFCSDCGNGVDFLTHDVESEQPK